MIKYNMYSLTSDSIDEIVSRIADYMEKLGEKSADISRVRLTVEELLIRISEHTDSGIRVRIGFGKSFRRHVLNISFTGEPYDPTDTDDDEWSSRILKNIGMSPAWIYHGKTNRVSLLLKERSKMSSLTGIIIALIASVILGACGRFIPEEIKTDIAELLLDPASSAFLGLLKTFAGFMIAFTVCSGILGMGSTDSLRKTGKRVILRYIIMAFFFSISTTLLALPFFNPDMTVSSSFSASHLKQISEMIFDILPKDPITPFMSGNSMQIIVIATLIGIVLLSLGERSHRVSAAVDEGTAVIQRATGAVCMLIPFFVFTELTSMIWRGESSFLLSLWKPLCIGIALMIIYSTIFLLVASRNTKRSPAELIRIVLPSFMIGLTTASSVATLSTSMEICEKKLGINKAFLNFAYPIGNVTCKYSTLSFVCIMCVSLASVYDVGITIPWIIMAVFMSTLLVFAVAPLPGTVMTIYTILIAQLGIPEEGILIAVTFDLLVDYIGAGFNAVFLMLGMTSIAKKG